MYQNVVHVDKPSPRPCPSCTRPLRKGNTSGLCYVCNDRAKRKIKRYQPPQGCVHPGCTRELRAGKSRRPDLLCGVHGDLKDKRGADGYKVRRMVASGVRCTECDTVIHPDTKTGRCPRHVRLAKKTLLRASSAHEHAANQTWARLSVEQRCALLGTVVQA